MLGMISNPYLCIRCCRESLLNTSDLKEKIPHPRKAVVVALTKSAFLRETLRQTQVGMARPKRQSAQSYHVPSRRLRRSRRQLRLVISRQQCPTGIDLLATVVSGKVMDQILVQCVAFLSTTASVSQARLYSAGSSHHSQHLSDLQIQPRVYFDGIVVSNCVQYTNHEG